jgi:hypothetical protein
MGKRIKEIENRARALELRLEEESNNIYRVILVGLTINLRGGCANGVCEGGTVENLLQIENQTYKLDTYNTKQEAIHAFDAWREQYIQ